MRFKLSTKFAWSILGIVALSLVSSVVAAYGAWRVNRRLEETARENLPTVRAEDAKLILSDRTALLAQYVMAPSDGRIPAALGKLDERFRDWLESVRTNTNVPDDESALLARLEQLWAKLLVQQRQLVSLIEKGESNEARETLAAASPDEPAEQARHVCDELIDANNRYVQFIMGRAASRVGTTTIVVGVSAALTLLLGGFLLWLFFYRVLFPLRGMVADARVFRGDPSREGRADGQSTEDELRLMGAHLRNLMSAVTDSQSRLEASSRRLQAAEKLASVGRLAAGVAHEIRNPLTAMKLWLFSIQESANGDASLRRKVGIISEEVTRLEAIVRDFLEFSRPVEPHRQPQDVGPIVDDVLELLAPRLAEAKIQVRRAPPAPNLPPALADRSQLKQVLLNLLGNAIDAMPAGGAIEITSAAETDADGRQMIVVRVADNGPGMPSDVQGRVFEPFFSTKEGGAGLGLCIAAGVMDRHGGAIVLESSTPAGTTFALWIPIATETADAQHTSR